MISISSTICSLRSEQKVTGKERQGKAREGKEKEGVRGAEAYWFVERRKIKQLQKR